MTYGIIRRRPSQKMAPDRLEQVFALFDAAAAQPLADREAYLAKECGSDAELRDDVSSLLRAHDEATGFLSSQKLSDGAINLADSSTPLQTIAPGTRLGVFEIECFIGAGGMGQVYKAHDSRLDRHVAIKVLRPDAAGDPRSRARFSFEARAVARLSHPRICALHDVAHHDGVDFLVMEFLEGETLAARLRRKRMSVAEAVRTGIEIGEALAAAHARGIVHRDLKPGNVMLAASGAKLLDFGLARLRVPSGADSPTMASGAHTTPGLIVGTCPYMSPEQLEGRDVDARADIFAFGSVLYEMIAGRRPFEGTSQAAVISAILSSEPAPLAPGERLAPALDRLIRTCLEKNRDDRWASMHDVTRPAPVDQSRQGGLDRGHN